MAGPPRENPINSSVRVRPNSSPAAGALSQPAGEGQGDPRPASTARILLGRLFTAESGNFYLLLGTTLFLGVLGLIMVLSSSAVESHIEDDNFFGGFWRQFQFAVLGVPLMLLVSRFPIRFWKKWAWPALLFGSFLQLLVVFTPLGVGTGGNQNWLKLGGFMFQPSEIIKLALVIWLGLVLVTKAKRLNDWKHALIPVLPIGGGAIALVMIGDDLGTVMIMVLILFAALFFAGVRLRIIAIPAVGTLAAILLLAVASPNRMKRIMSFLEEGCSDYEDSCWQPLHGTWALANGGVFGAGLGNSKAKWSWLPEASNDYIFAIIGEELGLIGAVVVLLLFGLLAVAFMRIIRQAEDPFVKIVTGSVMFWIIGQAFVNIAVVLRLMPVLGVPLPLISSGGTALVTSLIGIGIVLSFARHRSGGRAQQRSAR